MNDKHTFKDHFSPLSDVYARYRPSYPAELFAWLASLAPGREKAWDAGCGSGQAALMLAEHFEAVVATDASAPQIGRAIPHPRVTYRVATAEDSGLPDASLDLIVAAQALHWFDFDLFYDEVRRVLRPGGVIAGGTYGLLRIDPGVDRVVDRLYHEVVAPYWPPERRYVDEAYAGIPFPFDEIEVPPFAMATDWSFEQLFGYLGTWSAVRHYRDDRGSDPLAVVRDELEKAWGDPDRTRRCSWPLGLRVGRV